MDRVTCTGDEEKLTDCAHNEAGMDWNGGVDSSCDRDVNNVAVVCAGEGSIPERMYVDFNLFLHERFYVIFCEFWRINAISGLV